MEKESFERLVGGRIIGVEKIPGAVFVECVFVELQNGEIVRLCAIDPAGCHNSGGMCLPMLTIKKVK